ncbi:hypothetical protein B7P43_G18117 [Cryptotermes secundus]|uniref:Uncharacterized protein n=1 Tax=Cryptotermes secundus TaxID=105785 RepID=A0A2J7PGI3_9NEOP|nr:hypothetical protein B7P43_G18117 [Cryptotermes secundus]
METLLCTEPPSPPVSVNNESVINNTIVKLPTISLSKFSGASQDFMHFYDTFVALIISNDALTDIQRYYYLLSCLSGEPLMTLPNERHDSPKELRLLINQLCSNLNAAEALKIETLLHDLIPSHLVLERMSLNLRKQWENSSSSEMYPSLKDIIQFLESSCQTLEIVSSNKTAAGSQEDMKHGTSLRGQRRSFVTMSPDEYLRLGHMELVDPTDQHRSCYYMSHHAVVKNTSSTTKVRVVFNASAKTTSSLSLNDLMMVGPTIQQDLFSIALRFHTHSQRLETYRLTTVTYGTAVAPFMAT